MPSFALALSIMWDSATPSALEIGLLEQTIRVIDPHAAMTSTGVKLSQPRHAACSKLPVKY